MAKKAPSSSPRGRKRRADAAAAALESNFVEYQYLFVQFLIEHLVDAGQPFRGDYQEMLVLAVIGQARLQALRAADPAEVGNDAEDAAAESTNASRIADITGIPRQTVRRKLAALAEKGWIERDDRGAYRLASQDGQAVARRDMSDMQMRMIRRVARFFVNLEALIDGVEGSAMDAPSPPRGGVRNAKEQ